MQIARSSLAIAVLTASLVGVVVIQERRLSESRAHAGELALRNDSAAAAVDTTRDLVQPGTTTAAIAGDSLRVVQRRVVQMRQEKDALSAALNSERIAKAGLALTVDSLQRSVNSRTATSEDSLTRVRRASFDVRQAPYTVTAQVELPAAPDTGRLDIRIALDQIPVVARLSCAAPNADGIRPASIEATSPPWASVKFSDVQQSPDLCRSPALEGRTSSHWRPGVMIGIGLIAPSTSEVRIGGFVGVGFAYGR